MKGLSLYDALDLCALFARAKPELFERAAVRWHGRLELEAATLTLEGSAFALAAIGHLPQDPAQVRKLLRRLLRRTQEPKTAE